MKKWIILAVAILLVWATAFACSKKPAAPVAAAIEAPVAKVDAPYTVTKTAKGEVKPIEKKPVPKVRPAQRKVAEPKPKCHFLWAEIECP